VKLAVGQALLFVSGLGHYEAYLNGAKVGDRFLAPGWTDYRKTVLYDVYDVTAQLRPGPNAIAAIVGHGFHHVAPERYYKLAVAYGWPKLLAALPIEYADGSRETIATGPAWKAVPSPITFTSIYGGEDFDARLEPEVPVNAAAVLHVPAAAGARVLESGRPLEGRKDVVLESRTAREAVVALGSGRYRFEVAR